MSSARSTTASLAFAFALVSALLALVVMQALGTSVLDPGTFRLGIVVAAAAGGVTGALVRLLGARARIAWALVPLAGGVVGALIQWILLARRPAGRFYIISPEVSSARPVKWVLAGVPFGLVASVLGAGILFVALKMATRRPAEDARERVVAPLAAAAAILGAISVYAARTDEVPVVLFVVGLAAAAIVEIIVADRRRARFVRAVFAGELDDLEVVPLLEAGALDVPLVVGAVAPGALIVRTVGERGYREAARRPVAAAADTVEATLSPLARRKALLVAMLVASGASLAIALFAR